jgi:hypothetical protein
MIVDRWCGRLDDEDVLVSYGLANLDAHFAVGKALDGGITERCASRARHRGGECSICTPAEDRKPFRHRRNGLGVTAAAKTRSRASDVQSSD